MHTVILYGKSLIMSAVGASLKEHSDLNLVRVDPQGGQLTTWSEGAASGPSSTGNHSLAHRDIDGNCSLTDRLMALEPIAIVYDRMTVLPDFALALIDRCPEILVIGIDLACGSLLVVSGREEHGITTADLVRAIASAQQQCDRKSSNGPSPTWQATDPGRI